MTTIPAPAPSESLRFDAAYPRRAATLTLRYRGVPVEIVLNDADTAMVEKAIDGLLNREGWAAPASAPNGATNGQPVKRAPLPEPVYRADGETCCPWHLVPLRSGAHGLYCPSKETDPDRATPKGYCRFTVKE